MNNKYINISNKSKTKLSLKNHIVKSNKKIIKTTVNHLEEICKKDTKALELYVKHKKITKKIKVLEQRLVFITSQSLRSSCLELKKEDMGLLCRINEYLLS